MIYIASSWRNPYYEKVVKRLKKEGLPVYDFRNPPHGGGGFHWTDVDENAPNWTFKEYAEGLHHPLAERQFEADLEALNAADTCVLVLPCGRSAHTEAGWMAGAGKDSKASLQNFLKIPSRRSKETPADAFEPSSSGGVGLSPSTKSV